ncbi:MAG: hypothetical protein CMO61_09925 [Verrucomicrobiales bacterium]|nr:hypothetical protein [Verrucomicrobiales bacterium]|tara:strand:+ start:4200 stop:6800 length:2601 start_codon:yes stop_codon:yes gene_type:complete
MPQSIADEALLLIRGRRQQREAKDPKESAPLIDTVMAAKMLRLCGIGATDPVILCAYGDTNKFVPARARGQKNYDWAAVTAAAKNGERPWATVEAKLNCDTKNLGFISCPGGTRVKCKPGRDDIQEITEGQVLFFEVDKGLSREEQIAAPAKAGLPEPTFMHDTGGRSVWSYFVLDTTYPVDDVMHGRRALSKAIEDAHPGVKTDHSLWSPHQPARLVGGIHPKTGKRGALINVTGKRYRLDEILNRCPDLDESPKVKSSESIWRQPSPGDEVIEGMYPTPAELSVAIPLTLAIAKANVERITNGQQSGEGTGRPLRAYYLSRCLQAGYAQLQELGYDIDGTPEELFDTFCINSKNLGLEGLDDCRDRHYAEASDIGTGDKSKPVLLQDIRHWAEKNNHWRWSFSKSKQFKGFGANPSQCKGSTRSKTRKTPSTISFRLKVLDRYIGWFGLKVRNTLHRTVILRDIRKRLDLKEHLKDPELQSKVLEAHDRLNGNTYKALNHQDRAAMPTPTVEWCIPQLIPAKDATLIVGAPKVGKTRAAIAVVKSLLLSTDCLGCKPCGQVPWVIFVSDDQSAGDTVDMMKAAAIYEHPKLLWSQRFRLTADQLDQLLRDVKTHPGAVIVIDSLRSISTSTGVDENSAQMATLVYDLKQTAIDAGGTLVLVHHGSKSGGTGKDASSGHNGITGATNGAISIHHLEDENGIPQKMSHYRRVVREMRSGPPFDIVALMESDGSLSKAATFEEWSLKKLEQNKQAERQSKLQEPPKSVAAMLITMAELFDNKEEPHALLELMKAAKLCRPKVQVKNDCNNRETADYNNCMIWVTKLGDEGFITAHRDDSGTSGAQRRRLLELTQDGRNYIRGLNGAF